MALRSRSIASIAVALLVLAGVVAWWLIRTPPLAGAPDGDAARGTLQSAPAADAPDTLPAARDRPADVPLPDASDPAASASPGASALPALGGARARAQPLSAEGERRLDKFLAGLRSSSTDAQDYETLGRSEPADPDWSPRLEALIQQAIDRHAHEFGRLEIGRPRCSKSLCMLTAVATTRHPQQLPQADFQRLIYTYMMPEPWFRASFFDASTTVAGDATGDVYVSYFIRK
jgi:hypothetical protein